MATLAKFVAFVQQAGMYLRANQMQTRFSNLLDGVVELDVSAGDTTLTVDSAELQYGTIKLTGAPAGAFDLEFPDGYTGTRRIINASGETATVKTVSGSGIPVADGTVASVTSDGTNVVATAGIDTAAFLQATNNLGDLDDVPTAVANLGLDTVATEAYADAAAAAAAAAIVDSSPGTLDTLNELATALADDPNFATTIATSLGGKQPLDDELTALAGLTSAADTVPYFTGLGAAALAAFTGFGRSIVAAADLAALKTILSLVKGDVGLDNVANVDTTNAGNISSGTLNIGRLDTVTRTRTINFVIDGAGSAIATGIKGDIVVDATCTIVSATLLADVSGSIVVDIWRDIYGNYPPTNADSICAAAKPTIITATKSQDATLTGWTLNIPGGEVLRINVDSCTTITRATLSLKVTV